MKKYIFLIITSLIICQDTIGQGLTGDDLIEFVIDNFKPSNVLSLIMPEIYCMLK